LKKRWQKPAGSHPNPLFNRRANKIPNWGKGILNKKSLLTKIIKKALRNKLLSEHNEEEVKKIEDDLEKLHDVFIKVNPKKKYATNFEPNLSKKDERN